MFLLIVLLSGKRNVKMETSYNKNKPFVIVFKTIKYHFSIRRSSYFGSVKETTTLISLNPLFGSHLLP